MTKEFNNSARKNSGSSTKIKLTRKEKYRNSVTRNALAIDASKKTAIFLAQLKTDKA